MVTLQKIGVGQNFDSFVELKQIIEGHGFKHHVQRVISDSKTVQSTNKHISGSAKKYDDRFVHCYVWCKNTYTNKWKQYSIF